MEAGGGDNYSLHLQNLLPLLPRQNFQGFLLLCSHPCGQGGLKVCTAYFLLPAGAMVSAHFAVWGRANGTFSFCPSNDSLNST